MEYGAVLAEEMLRSLVRERIFRAVECDDLAFRLRLRAAKLRREDVQKILAVVDELEAAAAPLSMP